MNDKYKINDNRSLSDFKIVTFSGFKKTDVINAVLKSIEARKLEQACFWTTECICSGYSLILWDKLVSFSSKVIHINNPKLPYYMMRKNIIFNNQINRLDSKSKDSILLLRNSQMIRNLFFDVISTLSTSLKTKRYDKYTKINEKEDFKFENIKKRLCAQMNILPLHIIHFDDPDELKIIINEFFVMSKNKQFGYDRCCFWILWLIKWEAIHKKKGEPWNVCERNVRGVKQQHCSNVVWVIWEIIFEEVKIRDDENISKNIESLYEIFILNYSPGKRISRLPLIFNAVGYLTHEINSNVPLRSSMNIFIQIQSNVNKMFFSIKKNEKVIEKIVFKKLKNKEDVDVEILDDKINIFNEIDNIIMK